MKHPLLIAPMNQSAEMRPACSAAQQANQHKFRTLRRFLFLFSFLVPPLFSLFFFFSFVKYLKDKLTNCVWRGGEGRGGEGQDFSAKFHRCAAAAAAAAAVREIGRSRWILSEIISGE